MVKMVKNKSFKPNGTRLSKNVEISVFLLVGLFIAATICGCGGGGGGGGGKGGVTAPSATISGGDSGGGGGVPPFQYITNGDNSNNNNSNNNNSNNKVDSYAVMTGISDYPGTVNDLQYSAKDATDMHNALSASSVWSGGTMDVLTNSSATKAAIRAAITNAKNTLRDTGTFIFYYSGHGTNSGNTGYIVPYDALAASGSIVMANLINDTELNTYLSELPATVKKYVVIDSCYSGLFLGARALDELQARAKFVPMEGSDPNYNSEEFSTKTIVGVPNCYAMTSSRGSEVSWEVGGSMQGGVFTYYVCAGLGSGATIGGADADGNRAIMAEEMTAYVAPRVSSFVANNIKGYTQTPQSYDNYEGTLRVK